MISSLDKTPTPLKDVNTPRRVERVDKDASPLVKGTAPTPVRSLRDKASSQRPPHARAAAHPSSLFGEWTATTDALHTQFAAARPFEHVVITNFFEDSVLRALMHEFPDPAAPSPKWHMYDNPLEKKFALDQLAGLPHVSSLMDVLQSDYFVGLMRCVTGIPNLESDPYMHGAGLHAYPAGGKLDMHLDYSIHPHSGKERRVNLIVYLNDSWKDAYGGSLVLKDSLDSAGAKIQPPSNNTAILFRTCDVSYHGLPTPIKCPPGTYRKSLAVYYVSDPRPEASKRNKAEFYPLPGQPVCDRLARLYRIRVNRRIEPEDVADWPTWRQDGDGYW